VDFEVILFGPKTSDQCPMSEQDSEPWRKIPRASHQTQGVLFLRTLAQVEQDAKESGGQTCLILCWIASDFVSGTKTPACSFINYNMNIKVYKLLVISFI
jgi:hypothetical protein